MKHYPDYSGFSTAMQEDPILNDCLRKLILLAKIDVVVESGTFLGLGSTKFIAQCFLEKKIVPKRFVTIEVDFSNWCHAKKNLRPYPFVDCRWGCTVELDKALRFIETDEMLVNHQRYSDIYIDYIDDPVAGYTRELRGQRRFLEEVNLDEQAKDLLWDGEDVLAQILRCHREHRPLVVLDSAGGIGLLEFEILMDMMSSYGFFLLLDDVHHIKHYRSLQHIRSSPHFDIVGEGESWVLASHVSI